MNVRTVLLVAAVVCFVIDAIGRKAVGINLQSLGLALGFGSMLV